MPPCGGYTAGSPETTNAPGADGPGREKTAVLLRSSLVLLRGPSGQVRTFNRLLGDRRSSVEPAKNSLAARDQPKRARHPLPFSATRRKIAPTRAGSCDFAPGRGLSTGWQAACTPETAIAAHSSVVIAEAVELLRRNGGLATTAQLMTVMTRQQLDVQVANGGLVRVWHGVYARTQPDLLRRLAALDLVTGQDTVASMGTAEALYGFDTENTAAIHVLDPGHTDAVKKRSGRPPTRGCPAAVGGEPTRDGPGVDGGGGRPAADPASGACHPRCGSALAMLQCRRSRAGCPRSARSTRYRRSARFAAARRRTI